MSSNLLDKKLEYWEHQLLDLGKRNKMINYRETKRTTIKLVEPSFGELFNRLAINEETLTFQRSVDRETDIRVFSILSLLENMSTPLPVTIGDIKTEGSVLERQRTLKNLRAKARLALEEQGTNILYLSFGFIEWKDGKGASAQWIKSPLILVPAVLTLEALNSPYTLKKHEDDIVVNPTLEYYLKTEYGIDLPHFDADKDTLDGYLNSLEEIADQRGWRILKEVSLGLLSFLKISMYNDLLRNEERIKKNPVIRAMAGDSAEANDIPEHLRTFDLDSIGTQDCYQVMSADSSQQDAILYSKNNISFVMQGPPGTGKSQTITNIIAEALAEGKKVLFVSEKMAALQVVYRRLQEAHLGDFCLPLHSYKANKKEILEQIGANLKLKQTRVKDAAISNLEELLAIRQELNQYASELHKLNPELNISCYEVYSKLETVNDAPAVAFLLDNPLAVSQTQLQAYLNALQEYSLSLDRLNNYIKGNPWDGLTSRVSGYEYTEQMKHELEALVDKTRTVVSLLNSIIDEPQLSDSVIFSSIPELGELAEKVCALPDIPRNWIGEYNLNQSIQTATEAKEMYSKLFSLREAIGKVFADSIYAYDYNGWKEKLLAEAAGFTELPLVKNETANFFVIKASSLIDIFGELKTSLCNARNGFVSLNELLGINLSANMFYQRLFAELIKLLQPNIILNKNWFGPDFSRYSVLIKEARENAESIRNTKSQLLADWESEVLTLDYAPILLRYKTEYTSIFKVFKGQYKHDKKQIQALSKTVIKKLTDEAAVELLTALKNYHEKTNWFEEKKEELEIALGGYYQGVESDWEKVSEAVKLAEELHRLPIGDVPSRLVELFSRDHSKENGQLDVILSDVTASLVKAKTLIDDNTLDIDVDQADFDIESILPVIDVYLQKLAEISAQAGMLNAHLINNDEQLDAVYLAIEHLNSCANLEKMLSAFSKSYELQYEHLYKGEATDWDELISLLNKVVEIKQSQLFNHLSAIVNSTNEKKVEIQTAVQQLKEVYVTAEPHLAWICQQFSAETNLTELTATNIHERILSCLKLVDQIGNWIDYQEAKEKCNGIGLSDFVKKIEDGELYSDIEKIFLKGFYHMWLGAVCDKSASVRRFRRNNHDEKIKKFIELDDLQLLIAQMRIREKLIENLPSTQRMLKATDEVAILNKELNKKRNIMPLRKLFRLIPNLLMKLKPCLMMSPLSVSYFLETEAYHFDVVIFDEASQIFPEDAIGAIFRGSQVIIAGDSKQLPPTNFFSSTTNNFDGDYDISDEEDYSEVVSDSILEESASVLPNRTLLWHYRSKHENLIAFSNREIYKNNLITFPNSINNVPDMGVEYVYVEDVCYDRGGKKNNLREAQECVRLVFEHITKHPDRSLGIIAFSESQQTTIENAIIDYRERHPEFEWFFDESRDEPFFIKNLENVQGDERDTIIFSICYGKDKNGTMYMNFGPVGHNGGERRLNVAVTRAKCNIKLVGSILPSDIDVNRAKSEGARMLRSYIEYAMKGASALKPVDRVEAFESGDDFCDIIASFLEEHGYKIERQIGCSDYKIDIAIVNPDVEGEYIAGIECDGLSYIHAKTARDRDHLRRSVLQNMGWNLYRVWSTEWSRTPKAEGEALLNFIASVYDQNGNVTHAVKNSNGDEAEVSIDTIATETVKTVQKNASHNPYGFAYYKEANWWETNHSGSRDNLTRISENILHIVSVEQPIHMEVLYKRMGPSFTTGKATEGVKTTIDQAIAQKLSGRVVVDKDRFARLLPLTPVTVRIPKEYETPRPIEYVHTEEAAAAMLKIVDSSFGITEEDLASECARVFGFERKGPKIKVKTDAAIKFLVDNHKIRIIDGKAQIVGD